MARESMGDIKTNESSAPPVRRARKRASLILLVILVGMLLWLFLPHDWSKFQIELLGGTIQPLTTPGNEGRVAITFPDTVTDADLERLRALDRLHPAWVQLQGRQITGRALASLTRLTGLRGLTLTGTSIEDADLVVLEQFAEVETLNLEGNKISDIALEYLDRMPVLRCVSLRFTPISREALVRFQAAHAGILVLSRLTDEDDDG